MANAVEIECAECGSLYRVLTRSPDVTVLFRCIHCRGFSLYHLGTVLALNSQIMADGPDDVRREHLRQRMEDGVLDALADVRGRLDNIINVNADVDFIKRIYPPGVEPQPRSGRASTAEDAAGDPAAAEGGPPAISGFSEAPSRDAITDDEVADFRSSLNDPNFWDRLGGH